MRLGATDDRVTRSLRLYGEYAEGEVVLLRQLIKSGGQILDLAAHIGELTLPLAERVGPVGTVTAYEPEQSAYRVLRANVAMNGLDQVRTHAEPLAGAMDPGRKTNAALTLDSLALSGCDLIRVGRGGDPEALLHGAVETLRRHKPFLFFEDVPTQDWEPIRALLQASRYGVMPHPVPIYNPRNFRSNPENPFGDAVLHGMIGYPLP